MEGAESPGKKEKTAVRFARGRFPMLWELMELPQDLHRVIQVGVVGAVGVQAEKLMQGQEVILHNSEKTHGEISFQIHSDSFGLFSQVRPYLSTALHRSQVYSAYKFLSIFKFFVLKSTFILHCVFS